MSTLKSQKADAGLLNIAINAIEAMELKMMLRKKPSTVKDLTLLCGTLSGALGGRMRMIVMSLPIEQRREALDDILLSVLLNFLMGSGTHTAEDCKLLKEDIDQVKRVLKLEHVEGRA